MEQVNKSSLARSLLFGYGLILGITGLIVVFSTVLRQSFGSGSYFRPISYLLIALIFLGHLSVVSNPRIEQAANWFMIGTFLILGTFEHIRFDLTLFGTHFLFLAISIATILYSYRVGIVITALAIASLIFTSFWPPFQLIRANQGLLAVSNPNNLFLFIVAGISLIYLAITYTSYANSILEEQRKLASDLIHARETIEQEVWLQTLSQNITNEVNRSISTFLDPNRLIDNIVNQIKQSFDFYHVQVYLLDQATQELVIAGGTGEAGTSLMISEHRIPIGVGYVGQAAQEKRSIFAQDVRNSNQWLENPYLPDTQTEAAVPIFYDQNLVGVLDIQHDDTTQFAPDSLEILEIVAKQLGIALNNVATFQEIEKRAEANAAINQYALNLQISSDIQSILKQTAKTIEQLLQPETLSIKISPKAAELTTLNAQVQNEEPNGIYANPLAPEQEA